MLTTESYSNIIIVGIGTMECLTYGTLQMVHAKVVALLKLRQGKSETYNSIAELRSRNNEAFVGTRV